MILQVIGMLVLCGFGIYLIVAGLVAVYCYYGFTGSNQAFWYLIFVAIGVLLLFTGFYLSPFKISIIGG